LLDLAFLIDLTDELKALNTEFQDENKTINQMSNVIDSFKAKLQLRKTDAAEESCGDISQVFKFAQILHLVRLSTIVLLKNCKGNFNSIHPFEADARLNNT
jgi:hypothetical protein